MPIKIPVPKLGPSRLAPPPCGYPQSCRTRYDIRTELARLAANSGACASFYLDTVEGMSNDIFSTEGHDHHQGLARTHRLSDGSIYFFLSHSETNPGDKGSISQYRYGGPTDAAHVVTTSSLTVAPMEQLLPLTEQHPSDITFLPEVNGLDAGYLFVTEEYVIHDLAIYRWAPGGPFALQGRVTGFPTSGPTGPNFVFVDNFDGVYYLGVAGLNWGWVRLFSAHALDLFPHCVKGAMNVAAFAAVGDFPFHLADGPCQCKLVRDAPGVWSLLAFHSEPNDSENGTDYVDISPVSPPPNFAIRARTDKVHVSFRPGDTSFASTGTHYVEPSGGWLWSSS